MPIRIEPRHKQRLSGSGAPGRTRRQPVNTSEVFGAPLTEEEKRLMRKKILGESGRTISDADRVRLMNKYMNRNDGGIAQKTRIF